MPRTTPEDMIKMLSSLQGGVPVQSEVMGQEGPRRSMEQNLGMIQALRDYRPVESPATPGTPTQSRLQAEEAKRQFEEQMKLQREQMALQERLARASRAASGAGTASAGVSKAQVAGWVQDLAREAAIQGRTFSDVKRQLQQPQFYDIWEKSGMKQDEAIEMAKNYYQSLVSGTRFGEALAVPPQQSYIYEPHGKAVDYASNIQPLLDAIQKAATEDLSKYYKPEEVQTNKVFRDLVTGKLYYVDDWGRRIYEGDPGWGGTSNDYGLNW